MGPPIPRSSSSRRGVTGEGGNGCVPAGAEQGKEEGFGRRLAAIDADPRALLRLPPVAALVWALAVCLALYREPRVVLIALACPIAGLLVLRLDDWLGSRRAAPGARLGAIAVYLFMLAIWSASVLMWRRADGFFGIGDTGESAAIYLTSYHVHDLASFFLQDHAASSDPAATGYYYIHHPNFISRLLTMIGIALGMGLERIVLLCLMLSALSLLVAYFALRRLFTPGVAVVAVGCFGSSYGVYFHQAGDLLRGLHAVMLWALIYVMALEASAASGRAHAVRIALATLFVFIASSDWAFFVFCLAFYLAWHIYANHGIDFRHLFAWVLLPTALTFLLYFLVVISQTGVVFFAIDMMSSYFGRMGNLVSGTLLGHSWDPARYLDLYRAKHIVVWDANPYSASLLQVAAGYWRAMIEGGPWVARVVAAVFAVSVFVTMLRVPGTRIVKGGVIAVLAAICLGLLPGAWVLAPLAYLAFALPQLRDLDVGQMPIAGGSESRLLYDMTAWIAAALSAAAVEALLFPNYLSWLWDRGVSPVGVADAAAAGLLFHLAVRLAIRAEDPVCIDTSVLRLRHARNLVLGAFFRRGQRLKERFVDGPVGQEYRTRRLVTWLATSLPISALAALAALHLGDSYRLYRALPPLGPSYAAALKQPEFHGKLFVANTYDGLVWYFTRGTSMITTIVPPDLKTSTERFRNLRDGDNSAKYSRPDYFLCDNHRYFSFQRMADLDGRLCQMPDECSCRDVMAAIPQNHQRRT
jgi:hypothetical protein